MLNSECLEIFNKYLTELRSVHRIPSVHICEISDS